MKNIKPKVSVICITYNHAKFIRQALDGFVMQKTNFPFEVIVHDDASTDGTADIIREYAEKYPNIIKPILQTTNQWSQGISISKNYTWPAVRGEYVAICDGDDYWTDPTKLQKQADFLSRHPDYTICFHPVSGFYDDAKATDYIFPSRHEMQDISLNRLLKQNFIPNCSVMYRWQPNGSNLIQEWPYGVFPGDWFVHLIHAKHGKIKCLPNIMARYRRHINGVSYASEYGTEALHSKYGIQELKFYLAAEQQIAPNPAEYHKFVCERATEILGVYARNHQFDQAVNIMKMCPDLIQPADTSRIRHWKHKFNYLLATSVIVIISLITIGVILL